MPHIAINAIEEGSGTAVAVKVPVYIKLPAAVITALALVLGWREDVHGNVVKAILA